MLQILWAAFLLLGAVGGLLRGQAQAVSDAFLDGGKEALEMAFTMAGAMAMWSGVLKIGEKAGLMDALAKRLRPILTFLFPSVPENHPARGYIAANFAANILGLGWAATPAGLLAMESLQTLNKDRTTASNAICMFLVINLSSIQLVSITIPALRSQYGSAAPTEILSLALISTLISTFAGVFAAWLAEKRWKKWI